MRRTLLLLLLLLPTLASAQTMRRDRDTADWFTFPDKGCIGGSSCSEDRLRVPLTDRPVIAVRFHAHDDIGQKADGLVRVRIDGTLVAGPVDVPRRGQMFEFSVDELRGRALIIEAASNDEIEVSNISVLYGSERPQRRIPRDDRGRTGWQSYPRAAGCIGGDQCRSNGSRITVALEQAPVVAIRFYAHDNVGARADGKISVRIDDTSIASYVDVQRNGKVHEFDVDNVRGSRLVIATSSDDEVEISNLEVLYGRGGGRRGPADRETRHEGGCIGGDECGGRRARLLIPLSDAPVESIRFYARDDIGTRAGGRLRIQIDEQILEYSLDISREGRTYEINGKGLFGEFLLIFPADDDEVEIKDIRVRYGE